MCSWGFETHERALQGPGRKILATVEAVKGAENVADRIAARKMLQELGVPLDEDLMEARHAGAAAATATVYRRRAPIARLLPGRPPYKFQPWDKVHVAVQ